MTVKLEEILTNEEFDELQQVSAMTGAILRNRDFSYSNLQHANLIVGFTYLLGRINLDDRSVELNANDLWNLNNMKRDLRWLIEKYGHHYGKFVRTGKEDKDYPFSYSLGGD